MNQTSPRRVLMTADTVGGVWTYALELGRALGDRGVAVALATMGAPLSAAQWGEARRLANLEVFESAFKLEWMNDPWRDVRRAGEWLLELERRVGPDVVHLNGYAHAGLPWTRPALVAAHSCVLSWWRAVKAEAAPPEWNEYRRRVTRGLAAAGLVVCPSRAMLEALRACYGGAVRNARVIPNGRDPALFRPSPKGRCVLTAGRLWDEAKNVRALERIAPRLRWPVWVAGEENHPDGGRIEFSNVRFLGRLSAEDLARHYAGAPIYALPARYEPFGLSVLEAAMSGCALVLGDIPSLRENWNDAAVFVPPDDPDALAEALNGLIGDPSRRGRLGASARARALRFTPRRMAEAYLEAYSELAALREEAGCAS